MNQSAKAVGIIQILCIALAGCSTTQLSPPIIAALDCTQGIPASYRAPVTGAQLPPANGDVADLAKFADAQTDKLDQANGRTSDLIAIADTCQKRQQAVLTALAPKPWYSGLTSAWTALHGSQAAK